MSGGLPARKSEFNVVAGAFVALQSTVTPVSGLVVERTLANDEH
jgi:hypothetical protein